MALSATLHCLTGCAIGEVVGMVIGTALGWSNGATIALSIVLAFVFGYSLTSLPLLRGGLALAAVIPIALFVAGLCAYPVNRWLLLRGKGHTAVHETGIHGGPSPQVVGVIAMAAGAFGIVVLVADALAG